MHWYHSLRFKVFVATLFVALLPLLIVSFFFHQSVAGNLRDQTLASTSEDGGQAQAIIAARGGRLLGMAQSLASSPGLIQALTSQNRDALTTVLKSRSVELPGATLTVVDRSGTVLAQAGPAISLTLTPGSSLAAALDGRAGFALERAGPDGLSERAAAPVLAGGDVAGAVLAGQAIDAQFLSSLHTSTGVNAFAVLPNGSVVNARLQPADVARIQSAPDHLVDFVTVNGVPSTVYAWQLLDPAGAPIGQLGIVDSVQGLERTLGRIRQIGLLAAALSVLGAAAVAWVLSRIMLRPLKRISTAAQAIAAGERVPLAPLTSADEVGVLSRSLSTMVTALAANEDRLQQIIETMADGVLVLDQAGCYRLTNASAERLLGVKRSEIAGKAWYESPWRRETIDGARLPDSDFPFERIQRTREPVYDVEFVIIRQDGRRIVVSVNAAPLAGPEGEFAGMVASFTDVTERRRSEEQLVKLYRAAEQSRAETKAVFDAAHDSMALIAPDTRFVEVNRRFSTLFGIERDQVLGRRFGELSAEVDRTWDDSDAFKAFVTGSAQDGQRELAQVFVQRWPERRELELYSTPVRDAAGGPVGRLYAFRDITHEREVDRMKTEFVSLVSHELRTPLTSIKGYVDLLIEGEVGELSEEQAEFLTIVKNNADRLVSLVSDLLDVSRIEAGRIQLRHEPVDVARSLEQVAALMRPQIEQKQQHLTLDVQGGLGAIVGDPERVIQILTNLISNAHKYTPAGGAIVVRACQEGAQIRIDVEDNGIGMTPDEQAHLFTKFYRARNPASENVGGTGLGLTITRSLVELHGGTIEVESQPRRGTTFHLALPSTPAIAAPPESPAAASKGKRILVVEDEPDIANLIRRYLERAGYVVSVAHRAAEALRLARAAAPDLLTLDVVLPDADGFTLLEWMKHEPELAGIPVLMLSIVPDSGRGRLLGAVDYLSKPVQENVLLQRIGRILAQEQRPIVLLAESDSEARDELAGHLQSAGFAVTTAGDGREALALVRKERPSLALLDVHLPAVDGIEVLQAFRAEPETRDLPVVMLTDQANNGGASHSVVEAFGAQVLLSRPCEAAEVARVIAQGFGGAK